VTLATLAGASAMVKTVAAMSLVTVTSYMPSDGVVDGERVAEPVTVPVAVAEPLDVAVNVAVAALERDAGSDGCAGAVGSCVPVAAALGGPRTLAVGAAVHEADSDSETVCTGDDDGVAARALPLGRDALAAALPLAPDRLAASDSVAVLECDRVGAAAPDADALTDALSEPLPEPLALALGDRLAVRERAGERDALGEPLPVGAGESERPGRIVTVPVASALPVRANGVVVREPVGLPLELAPLVTDARPLADGDPVAAADPTKADADGELVVDAEPLGEPDAVSESPIEALARDDDGVALGDEVDDADPVVDAAEEPDADAEPPPAPPSPPLEPVGCAVRVALPVATALPVAPPTVGDTETVDVAERLGGTLWSADVLAAAVAVAPPLAEPLADAERVAAAEPLCAPERLDCALRLAPLDADAEPLGERDVPAVADAEPE